MKKIFIASTALLLAGGIMSAASAAEVKPGFNITGNARARLSYTNSYDFGNVADRRSNSWMDSRVRFEITGTAAGGAYVKGRIRLMDGRGENNDLDSAAGAWDLNRGNLWVDKAYIGIPFSDSFTLEAGKYRVTYGNSFLYDDVNLAGFRGIIKAGMMEINPFVEWMSEGQSSKVVIDKLHDNDSMRFGANVSGKFTKDWSGGVLLAYQTDSRDENRRLLDGTRWIYDEPNEGFFGSIYFKGKAAGFGLAGELAYSDAELHRFTQDPEDINGDGIDSIGGPDNGWGGFIMPSYTIDKLTLALHMGFTKDGFMPDPAVGFVMVGAEHPITVINVGAYGDWLWAGLVAKYAISEAMTVTGNFVYADIDGSAGVINGRHMGAQSLDHAYELSGVLQYTISKGADFFWYAGYLAPSFDDPRFNDVGAVGTYASFVLSF